MSVTTLVRKPKKAPVWDGPKVRCGECGHEFTCRKTPEQLKVQGVRRCPKCGVRLVAPTA